MIRQIDTGIGIIVGGLVGWFNHEWPIWLVLLAVLIFWGYVEKPSQKKEGKNET